MVKDEIWSVSMDRATAFFEGREDVVSCENGEYEFKSCRIKLTELKAKGMGIWAAKRIKLHMEGENDDVEEIYHHFFIQFLSTGG